jgi:hypothetical protein
MVGFVIPGWLYCGADCTQLVELGVAADELAGEASDAALETVLAPLPEAATGAGAAVATGAGAGGCTPIEIGCSG